jgi:hypothetical protein
MPKGPKRYRFEPVGFDLFDAKPHQPAPGTIVVKTQPYGCPKNGTMGFCYVKDAETDQFYGLVLLNSLEPVR